MKKAAFFNDACYHANDVCFLQMIMATPNDVRFASDVCLTAHNGKLTPYLRACPKIHH